MDGIAGSKVSCVMANGQIHTGSVLGMDSLRNVSLSNVTTTSTTTANNHNNNASSSSSLMLLRGANMLYLDVSDS